MSIKSLVFLLLVVFVGYFYINYMGGGSGDVVADVLFTSDKTEKNLDIEFQSPVRYLGHFPEQKGDILQIKFRAIAFDATRDNYSLVEKLNLVDITRKDYIDDVRYEGNVPGGPFIVIRFTRPVSFIVTEGTGLRSININFKLT